MLRAFFFGFSMFSMSFSLSPPEISWLAEFVSPFFYFARTRQRELTWVFWRGVLRAALQVQPPAATAVATTVGLLRELEGP